MRPFFLAIGLGVCCYGAAHLTDTYRLLTHRLLDPGLYTLGFSAIFVALLVGLVLLLGVLLHR